MKTMLKIPVIAFFILLLGSISCQDNELIDNNSEEGNLILKITDAPFPIDSVSVAWIKIEKIEIGVVDYTKGMDADDLEKEKEKEKEKNKENGNNGNGNGKNKSGMLDDDPGVSFVTVSTKKDSINLLTLSNGITKILKEAKLPSGIYNQLKLYITEAGIKLKNKQVFTLKVPSGTTSGLKILINPSVMLVKGKESSVLIDVDLSHSFVMLGNVKNPKSIHGFIFKPVIRAVNQTETGKVFGMVTDASSKAIDQAIIYLKSGSDTITSALTNKTGMYAIIGIPVGSGYKVSCEKEGFKSSEKENVKIENGQSVEVNFKLDKK